MADFQKIERAGNVAVLYSPGYGAGWSTWNSEHDGLLFDADIVNHVLDGDLDRAIKVAEEKYPGVYVGGGRDLTVAWVPKGARFEIHEYDGSESVRIFGPDDGLVA